MNIYICIWIRFIRRVELYIGLINGRSTYEHRHTVAQPRESNGLFLYSCKSLDADPAMSSPSTCRAPLMKDRPFISELVKRREANSRFRRAANSRLMAGKNAGETGSGLRREFSAFISAPCHFQSVVSDRRARLSFSLSGFSCRCWLL